MKNAEKIAAPPRLALTIFRWFCHPDFREEIEGDLLEKFQNDFKKQGPRRAGHIFWLSVLRLFHPGIVLNFFKIKKTYRMEKSKFFKIAAPIVGFMAGVLGFLILSCFPLPILHPHYDLTSEMAALFAITTGCILAFYARGYHKKLSLSK